MKIIKDRYHSKPIAVSISHAVAASLEDDDGGVAENARNTAINCAKAIGVLIERMHENRLISDDDVATLLNYRFELVQDDG